MTTFDGIAKRIILDPGTTEISVTKIYSEWKLWVLGEEGSQYEQAFATIGGEPIGGGVGVGAYYFLNTADGWLIRPQEASHVLVLDGNLFPVVAGSPLIADTLGVFQVRVEYRVSSLTQQVGGVTQQNIRDAMLLNPTDGTPVEPKSVDRQIGNAATANFAR